MGSNLVIVDITTATLDQVHSPNAFLITGRSYLMEARSLEQARESYVQHTHNAQVVGFL